MSYIEYETSHGREKGGTVHFSRGPKSTNTLDWPASVMCTFAKRRRELFPKESKMGNL
jgi:hypothetical protein